MLFAFHSDIIADKPDYFHHQESTELRKNLLAELLLKVYIKAIDKAGENMVIETLTVLDNLAGED